MKIFEKIILTEEFEKDLKKLKKRFKTLDSDLENFINIQLKLFHKIKINNNGIFRLQNLDIIKFIEIYYKGDKENENKDRIKKFISDKIQEEL